MGNTSGKRQLVCCSDEYALCLRWIVKAINMVILLFSNFKPKDLDLLVPDLGLG